MTINEIRHLTELTQQEFAEKYHIPLATLKNWEASSESMNHRECPAYVRELLERVAILDYGSSDQNQKMYLNNLIELVQNALTEDMLSQRELKTALWGNPCGDIERKQYLKKYIRTTLEKNRHVFSLAEAEFQDISKMSSIVKHETVLYLYKKNYGDDGFAHFIQDIFGDNKEREMGKVDNVELEEAKHCVTQKMLDNILEKIYAGMSSLSDKPIQLDETDKLNIITQYIYQSCYGMMLLDSLYYMKIKDLTCCPTQTDKTSVWVMLNEIYIKLDYLRFEKEDDFRELCERICKEQGEKPSNKGACFTKNYIDGTRVVVIKPPVAESFSLFMRKFEISEKEMTEEYTYSRKQLAYVR